MTDDVALARLLPARLHGQVPSWRVRDRSMIYRFDEFTFDDGPLVLCHAGERLRLPRRVLEVLSVLLRRSGEIVTREEVLAEVWQGAHVEDAVLTQAIFLLRKTLGDNPTEPRFVATIQGRGYVFLGAVAPVGEQPPLDIPATTSNPPQAGTGTWRLRWRRSRGALVAGPVAAAFVAAAFIAAFRFWPVGTSNPPTRIHSLAIVTFTNYGSGDDAHFSAGLTDAVVAALAARSEIPIRSLDAGRSGGDAGTDPSPRRAVESDAVLTGGYLRAGNTLRVTARLDESRTGRALWAGKRDFVAGNLLRLQDEITLWLATSLSRELPGTWSATSQDKPGVPAIQPTAYEAYLKARHLLSQRNERGIGLALTYFSRAIQHAPDYAPAHAGLAEADALMGIYDYGTAPPLARYQRARLAARRAVELDPRSGEGWAILGIVSLLGDLDVEASQRHLDRAVSLAPYSARAHHWRAWVLYLRGNPHAAEEELGRARQLDPLSAIIRTAQGTLSFYRGHLSQSRSRYREVLELEPTFGRARLGLGMVAEQEGKLAVAEEHLRIAASQLGDPEEAWAALAHLYGRTGRRAEWEAVFARLGGEKAHPYARAQAWLGVGDERRALQALRDAIDQRRIGPWDLVGDPRLRAIGGPAFDRLVTRAGLRPAPYDTSGADPVGASGPGEPVPAAGPPSL